MSEVNAKLIDGSEWIEHEDCIVGNEEGLRNLIRACELAIETGEHYNSGLGDYAGVKKKETEWFKKPSDSPQTRAANIGLGAFLASVVALAIVGIIATVKWIF